ncbi:hypothetical protein [Actinoallomurus soli]|uniref:hypothetical protein n=1 Tax=Actinoallomurus soli TaxID=2952535 RepID=UPI002093C3F3|nr:hypothetical protein [Actinoallomurus soli]MCO5975025.1 hypothetical protein [Actinoallomurus soli]
MNATSTDTVHVQAHYDTVKRLGHWTTTRDVEVRARRGGVVLDLRSPRIPEGDLEIRVDLDHSMLKLLVPDDAVIDHWDLEWLGRGRVKDAEGAAVEVPGRRIRLTGRVRHCEVRVNRAGVAVLSAMFSREFLADARRAHKEGGTPSVADPARDA